MKHTKLLMAMVAVMLVFFGFTLGGTVPSAEASSSAVKNAGCTQVGVTVINDTGTDQVWAVSVQRINFENVIGSGYNNSRTLTKNVIPTSFDDFLAGDVNAYQSRRFSFWGTRNWDRFDGSHCSRWSKVITTISDSLGNVVAMKVTTPQVGVRSYQVAIRVVSTTPQPSQQIWVQNDRDQKVIGFRMSREPDAQNPGGGADVDFTVGPGRGDSGTLFRIDDIEPDQFPGNPLERFMPEFRYNVQLFLASEASVSFYGVKLGDTLDTDLGVYTP